MRPGDVVRARTLRHYYAKPKGAPGLIYDDWTAAKEKVYVLLLVGVEPQDGSAPMDVIAALEDLGWTAPAGLREAIEAEIVAAAEAPKQEALL